MLSATFCTHNDRADTSIVNRICWGFIHWLRSLASLQNSKQLSPMVLSISVLLFQFSARTVQQKPDFGLRTVLRRGQDTTRILTNNKIRRSLIYLRLIWILNKCCRGSGNRTCGNRTIGSTWPPAGPRTQLSCRESGSAVPPGAHRGCWAACCTQGSGEWPPAQAVCI